MLKSAQRNRQRMRETPAFFGGKEGVSRSIWRADWTKSARSVTRGAGRSYSPKAGILIYRKTRRSTRRCEERTNWNLPRSVRERRTLKSESAIRVRETAAPGGGAAVRVP